MDDSERLAVAALTHDLPPELQRELGIASLDAPLDLILRQAEQYAMPAGSSNHLVTNQPLVSIFSRIQLYTSQEPPAQYHQFSSLPATTISQTKLFPGSTAEAAVQPAHMQKLEAELREIAQKVDKARFDHVYIHLLSALHKYGWCLPAHSPDLSLFDHAKLTSAIAVCLYRYHEGQLTNEAIQAGATAERFCLLVGDLSGIQDYIFDITTIGAGGVARRLRARSFYLSALSDVVSHQVAFRFQAPLGNVIMSSGGKFYVLLPNLGDLKTAISDLRREIDGWFQKQFNDEIAVHLAYECFAGDRFQASSESRPGFGDVVGMLSRKLSREKRRRGQSHLVANGGWREDAFVMGSDFEGASVCDSCRKFPGHGPDNLCTQCALNVVVGKKLTRTQYVAYYKIHAGEEAIPMPLGYSVRVLAEEELSGAGEAYLVVKLNDPDISELRNRPATFRYLANYVPLGDYDAPLSFEDIAKAAEGRTLLGYVKADVDYLGMLFAQGLRRDGGGYDTATHIAALSRELDLFFSGWIQHLVSQTPTYQKFYTIFSGGDDLFLVGPWDRAAALARAVRDRFLDFVGRNPDISISAGVLFTKERYPISRAATDAEKMLEASKEHEWDGADGKKHTRDQITILGETLRWDVAPKVFAEIDRLKAHSEHLTSALLYNLVEYGRLYRLWKDEGKIEGLRYKPLFAYNIARNLRKNDDEIYKWADDLMQSLQGDKPSLTMRYLGLIATYMLFFKRDKPDSK